MKRKEFLKTCASGACSCAALGFLLPGAVPEASAQEPLSPEEIGELKWKLNAAQIRFAGLIGVLERTLDEAAMKKVLENLGAECSRSYEKFFAQYKGNIEGFLDHVRKNWVEKAEYDPSAGTIRITDKAEKCTCPLVKEGTTPGSFCDCTIGWQKAAYSAVLGRPVVAELEESILRGGKRCIFKIRIG